MSRVAVVTGSNKGIGFAIVRALCKQFEGTVYLTARNFERGMEAVKKLEAEGLNPKFHLLDVTDQTSIETLKKYLVETYGGVDVLIHNAAIAYKSKDPAPFSEQSKVSIEVNFTCTRNLCNTFLHVLKESGRLVILSSWVSLIALDHCSVENQQFFKSPDLTEEQLSLKLDEFVAAAQNGEHRAKGFADTAYGMSKLGVTAFTRILGERAKQCAKPGVLINCCCPGWVRTDMAGDKATLSPDQGAETPVFTALLPSGTIEPNGKLVKDKKVKDWY